MKMPDIAQQVIRRLNRAGYSAYLVGGCVRDLLMGRSAHDIDIATSALPQQTEDVFFDCSPFSQGGRFGTVGIIVEGQKVEITTFRTETGYSDHRRPDTVRFVTEIREDLSRRDFTVNSMALHPDEGLVDPFGGQEDLHAAVLRTTGDPRLRFEEDALRILRLFRFCAKLGFSIDQQTLQAAQSMRGGLADISAERVTAELCELLFYDDGRAVKRMTDCGIFTSIGFDAEPEGLTFNADVKGALLRLTLICRAARTSPQSLLRKLRLSNLQQRRVEAFDQQLTLGAPLDRVEIKRRMRMLPPEDLKAVSFCWSAQGSTVRQTVDEILDCREPYLPAHLAVGGGDLLQAGVCPREIGGLLTQALEAVLADPSKNQKQLLLRQIVPQKYV